MNKVKLFLFPGINHFGPVRYVRYVFDHQSFSRQNFLFNLQMALILRYHVDYLALPGDTNNF